MNEISEDKYLELVAETEAFNYGRNIGMLKAEKKSKEEIALAVEEWKKYRNTLPRDAAVMATQAFRYGYRSQVPK